MGSLAGAAPVILVHPADMPFVRPATVRAVRGWIADAGLEAWSLAMQAVYQQALNHPDQARALIAQADRIVRRHGDAHSLVWVRFAEARLALESGEPTTALRLMQQSLRLAEPLHSPRMQARILPSLSDLLRRTGRPREALQAVESYIDDEQQQQIERSRPAMDALGQREAARNEPAEP